jgi:hypothetical protein
MSIFKLFIEIGFIFHVGERESKRVHSLPLLVSPHGIEGRSRMNPFFMCPKFQGSSGQRLKTQGMRELDRRLSLLL